MLRKVWNCARKFARYYQGSTIDVLRVRTYGYFFWRTHNFGYAHVETYAHFFLMTF